jgi:hypothetical protein
MKKKKSIKFLKKSLQLLALQFRDIVIRYGLNNGIGMERDMHVIHLTPEDEFEANKSLRDACFAIEEAFEARFTHEDIIFTAPCTVLCIKELIIEFNKDISEYDRLNAGFPRKIYPPMNVANTTESVTEEAA